MDELFHYFLITGEVTYVIRDGNVDHINRVNLNTLAPLKNSEINLKIIGTIQQQLQKQLFNRLGAPEKVLDVVITNIAYLGHMTKAQFGSPEDANKNE